MICRDNIALLFLVFTAGVWNGCTPDAPDAIRGVPLAHVNGEPLMSETFRDEYVGYLLKTGLQDKSEYRQQVLNAQVASMLLVQEAKDQGIESDKSYSEAASRIKKKLLVDIYVRKALFDTIQVSEDELKDMFVKANTTLKARHLYAPDEIQATALYNRIVAGETFEALAREVFADTTLANNGGYIGEFSVDDMDRAFEEVAFGLEIGEVSKPVRTAQGYSIIRVEDRFVKPLLTEYEYAERRDRMYQFVSYRKKSAARASHISGLLDDLAPRYNPPVFDRLYGFVTGEFTMESEDVDQAWFDETLVSFASEAGPVAWTVADFQHVASETSDKQRSRVRTQRDLEEFISALIAREEMALRAAGVGYDRDPEFDYEYQKALDNWIWSTATQAIVSNAQPPADSLDRYYQAHREDFVPAPLIEVSEILLDEKEKAHALMEVLDRPSFATEARKHSIRPGADATGGYLGYVRQSQLGVLWGRVANAKSGEILGPIEVDGHYVILMIGERKEAKDPAAALDTAEILKHFRAKNSKRLIQDHVSQLISTSAIAVNDSLLMALPLKQSDSVPTPILN